MHRTLTTNLLCAEQHESHDSIEIATDFIRMALVRLCEFRDVRFVHTKLHFIFVHVLTTIARRTRRTIQLNSRLDFAKVQL